MNKMENPLVYCSFDSFEKEIISFWRGTGSLTTVLIIWKLSWLCSTITISSAIFVSICDEFSKSITKPCAVWLYVRLKNVGHLLLWMDWSRCMGCVSPEECVYGRKWKTIDMEKNLILREKSGLLNLCTKTNATDVNSTVLSCTNNNFPSVGSIEINLKHYNRGAYFREVGHCWLSDLIWRSWPDRHKKIT